ncbi:unnamed protein product [Phyllotreta striolata]|uniref:Male-enhanced antigen 1 n=1 Tax=Phyllotreta striolata TaxID=444603 RepID=A0A9N9TZ42_PHYSR|nr:unnamed protein product [Phyllotreta striolata]
MVKTNNGLPDPDNPVEDFKINNDIIMGFSEDDSDGETEIDTYQNDYAEYQPLPTEKPTSNSDTEESADEDIINNPRENNTGNEDSSVPPITPIETTLVMELWSRPAPDACDIQMDNEKVQQVKNAMLNVTLPASAIPDWAANVPEEEWKSQLMKRLKH